MNKEMALFGWYQYYPSGGFNDFICKFTTKEELVETVNNCGYDNYEIVEMELFQPVFSFSSIEDLEEIRFQECSVFNSCRK